MSKSDSIKNSLKETKQRRKSQDCKVFRVKFDRSKLGSSKKSSLNRLFLEAKWIWNAILASENPIEFDTKVKQVTVLNKNKESELRELTQLSSQMKQGVKTSLLDAFSSLSKKKQKGQKVGKVQFKSEFCSIDLKQYGSTHKIKNQKYIQLQGFGKQSFRVNGLKQIPKDAEIANAKLIKRHKDFYLNLTCYVPKSISISPVEEVGIDFGIKDDLTLSNGTQFKTKFPIPVKLKREQKKLKNKELGSKNRKRQKEKIKRQYQKLVNQKTDRKNKIVSRLINTYETICVQDENIKGWHSGLFGRQVQQSILGGIMRDLKRKSHTLKLVDRYFPSTKLCPDCGTINKIGLNERTYVCSCGYTKHRDVHSAGNILLEGTQRSTERRLKLLGEPKPNTLDLINLRQGYGCRTNEAQDFSLG